MGGFFGVVSKSDCVFDLFYGVDYHSHLGTRRAGMAVWNDGKITKAIHKIENSPFRTKFEKEAIEMKGNMGIGCISDFDSQPLVVRSNHGTYAITCVGKINNAKELEERFLNNNSHFLETSTGDINNTELVASIINQKKNLIEGLQYVQEVIDGSMTILLLNEKGIYCSRDKYGRTPIVVGKKDDGTYCVTFESFAFLNLGCTPYKELGPGEIAVVSAENGLRTLVEPGNKMRICTFLWIYYGYPSTVYEGLSVEKLRCKCGEFIAKRDNVKPDSVAGVPDSGLGAAIGYSNASGIPFQRPFVKYTPTWPRSFMPTMQTKRNLIAHMKLIPIHDLIDGKKLLLIDDSIVRGTQMRETTEFLYKSGASEVHVRSSCPPILYGCKYLNFSASTSEMELIARRAILALEGNVESETIKKYLDADSKEYANMVEYIREKLNFTSLGFMRLDDLKEAVEMDPEKICTYCWDGRK
ncbi:MAG: amidophosphoribosyltransferase [Bacilli bacterium]|nr:amidophosphoribosyltransferase [Bacilli bacterium]